VTSLPGRKLFRKGQAVKSVQRKLSEASDLAAVLRIANGELITVYVYGFEPAPTFQLKLEAFARVFQLLKLPRKALSADASESGHLHLRFSGKGAIFTCCVAAEKARPWLEQIERARAARLGQQREAIAGTMQLALPAPL